MNGHFSACGILPYLIINKYPTYSTLIMLRHLSCVYQLFLKKVPSDHFEHLLIDIFLIALHFSVKKVTLVVTMVTA